MKDHGSLRQRDAGSAAQLVVDGGEQCELFFDADREGIDLAGRDPGGFVLRFGRERDVVFLGEGAGASDVDGERGRGFDAGAGEIVGGGESPAAIGEHADSDAGRFVARDLAGLAVLGAELAVATFDDADVGVGDARAQGRIERFERELLHRFRIAGWWGVGGGWWVVAEREFFRERWRKWGCFVCGDAFFQIRQNEPTFGARIGVCFASGPEYREKSTLEGIKRVSGWRARGENWAESVVIRALDGRGTRMLGAGFTAGSGVQRQRLKSGSRRRLFRSRLNSPPQGTATPSGTIPPGNTQHFSDRPFERFSDE